jgi:hypothetical protein
MSEVDAHIKGRAEFERPPARTKGRDSIPEPVLEPTRSGRSLENRAAGRKGQDPVSGKRDRGTDRRSEIASIEIASLKAQLHDHDTLQSQWKIAQEELAAQKHARVSESTRMADRVSSLECELDAASTNAASAIATLSNQRNRWRAVAAGAGVLALGFLFLVFWPMLWFIAGHAPSKMEAASRPSTAAIGAKAPGRGENAVALNAVPRNGGSPRIELPSDPPAALTTALDRLNGALETVPGHSPEDVLRKISRKGQGCLMIWTSNVPSLVFGHEPRRSNSLAWALEDCAEAVSRLH